MSDARDIINQRMKSQGSEHYIPEEIHQEGMPKGYTTLEAAVNRIPPKSLELFKTMLKDSGWSDNNYDPNWRNKREK